MRYWDASALAVLGRSEQALAELESAVNERLAPRLVGASRLEHERTRADARYQALLARD